jgi:hypothetical protein
VRALRKDEVELETRDPKASRFNSSRIGSRREMPPLGAVSLEITHAKAEKCIPCLK